MTSHATPPAPMDLYAIAPTRFDSAMRVDVDAMVQDAERLSSSGIRRFLLTGSYGEFQSLTGDERVRILESIVTAVRPVSAMACAACPSTDATVSLARRMVDAGADLVMVSVPLACELTDADILRHFEHLAESVEGRLAVYNNPVFGVDLAPAVLGTIAGMGGYAAIKQGTRDLGKLLQSLEAVRAARPDVLVLAASDMTAAGSLLSGVQGLTSTNCWVFPEVFPTMIAAAGRGDAATVGRLGSALEPYRAITVRYGQPATVKAAMRLRGYGGSDRVRLPYAALDADAARNLAAAIEASDQRLASVVPAGAMA